jgi:hypothetical protein
MPTVQQLSDDYRFYYQMLQERGQSTQPFPLQPQPGRYRIGGSPVALWRDPGDGKLRLRTGVPSQPIHVEDDDTFKTFSLNVWNGCVAVTKEEYDSLVADLAKLVHAHHPTHNQPPAEGSLEDIRERVRDLTTEAQRLIQAGAAATQDTADTAADLANMLTKLSQLADNKRKEEQQEWREQIAVSNAQWHPVRDAAADVSVKLKQIVIDPYLDQVEAAAKAELERQAQQGVPAHPQASETRITAGTRGRPVSRRSVSDVAIIDYHLALDHFKDHPDMVALVKKLAARAAKLGVAVPGTEIVKGKVSV